MSSYYYYECAGIKGTTARNLGLSYIYILRKRPFGFPDSSAGKESTCNAGDPASIPGWGSSPREGIGHPLLYSWASLVAQLVKNPPAMHLPAMQDTWV